MILALGEAWRGLLAETRRFATDVRAALVRAGGSEADEKKLGDSAAQLDDLFLIVVVGEWNAGKSALLNALLGAEVLEEGVTPTTSRIALVRHGDALRREPGGGGYDVVTAPLEALRETSFVDTAPPAGGATYRIGVATNWLDDPEQGDVFAFSPPALAND